VQAVDVEESAAKKDDEDDERPAEAFNPLLFRALQGVAGRMEQPPQAV
jgi:hypothetical protein